jgi:hypothetical protein
MKEGAPEDARRGEYTSGDPARWAGAWALTQSAGKSARGAFGGGLRCDFGPVRSAPGGGLRQPNTKRICRNLRCVYWPQSRSPGS